MAYSVELATLLALARTLADAFSSLSTLAHAPAGTVPSSFEPAATSLALARTTADALRERSWVHLEEGEISRDPVAPFIDTFL